MITHVVLLQLKQETTQAELDHALAMVKELQQSIPDIVDVRVGANLSVNHHGYTSGFIMHIVDTDHLKAYALHPTHRIASTELVRICTRIIDFDLETT